MNNNSSSSASAKGGVGFCGLLTIVFIVLKLLGKIDWSWIWVFSPLWIPFVLWIIVVVLIIGFFYKK